jgi:hypothetical protein
MLHQPYRGKVLDEGHPDTVATRRDLPRPDAEEA